MRKIRILLVSTLVLLMLACVEFKRAKLPEVRALTESEEIEDEQKWNTEDLRGGLLDDFSSLHKWEVSHPESFIIDRKEKALRIMAKNVGPKWEQISRNFPLLDLSKTPIVILRAKVDGWQVPVIRLDLIDATGKMTNARPATCKIAPFEGYQDYVFRFNNAWKQSWPSDAKVDSSAIKTFRFNVNGGSRPFSGTLYFKELKLVSKYP